MTSVDGIGVNHRPNSWTRRLVASPETGRTSPEPGRLAPVNCRNWKLKERSGDGRKKRMVKEFDLVAAQVKHWLERAEAEGMLVRREYPKGKKGKVVMCEKGPNA